jgi:hypothetical protein
MYASPRPIHQFPYRPSRLKLATLLALALGGMAICSYFALYAEGGARSARGVELTRDQFRLLTGIIALFAPLGVLALAFHLAQACRSRRRAAIAADRIYVPRDGLTYGSTNETEIPLEAIESTCIEHLGENDYVLVIVHREGIARLLSNRFARRCDFDRFATRLHDARTQGQST